MWIRERECSVKDGRSALFVGALDGRQKLRRRRRRVLRGLIWTRWLLAVIALGKCFFLHTGGRQIVSRDEAQRVCLCFNLPPDSNRMFASPLFFLSDSILQYSNLKITILFAHYQNVKIQIYIVNLEFAFFFSRKNLSELMGVKVILFVQKSDI
jgi:hypothetical protein